MKSFIGNADPQPKATNGWWRSLAKEEVETYNSTCTQLIHTLCPGPAYMMGSYLNPKVANTSTGSRNEFHGAGRILGWPPSSTPWVCMSYTIPTP